MILNEATFTKLDHITPVNGNKTYEFDGVPTLGRLTRLEQEITKDIVSIAAGGLVYVRDQNERNRKGLCEVVPEVDSTGISKGKLGSFALNCKSHKFDPAQYFTFSLADLMTREKYLLIKKHPTENNKWVPDAARYSAIQRLLDRMAELAAECDAATREYRDAQGYDRPRNARQTIEQRFEQEITTDVTYLGQNELHNDLVWLATHILTISANINSKLLPVFKKYFGDTNQSVTVVDAAKRTKNGAPAKYSWSFHASLRNPESMPNSLKVYLNEQGTAINNTSLISKLVRNYGFSFGRNNVNLTLKNLADILNDPDIASLTTANENLKEGIEKMAAKITKSELKHMIREALREELCTRKHVKTTIREDLDIYNLDAPKVSADGKCVCNMCKNTFQPDEVYNTVFGNNICNDCNDDYISSSEGDAESFFIVAKDSADWYEAADIRAMIKAWLVAKKKKALKFTDAEISAIEDAFVNNVEDAGLAHSLTQLNKNRQLNTQSGPTNYRVVLADYDTDDFDINVEFGLQDPDENEVTDYEYLLLPGQTKGDLVVYLSRDCGFTSIYVHDERPASSSDVKRLASMTFSVTGTGEDWEDYGTID